MFKMQMGGMFKSANAPIAFLSADAFNYNLMDVAAELGINY